jgi:hypothetical protein
MHGDGTIYGAFCGSTYSTLPPRQSDSTGRPRMRQRDGDLGFQCAIACAINPYSFDYCIFLDTAEEDNQTTLLQNRHRYPLTRITTDRSNRRKT